MKLLSPLETRTKRETHNETLNARSVSLDDAISSKRNELFALDGEFVRRIEEQRTIRAAEEEKWRGRNDELRVETEELENRRRLALVPLQVREKEVQDTEEALLQRKQDIERRERDLDDTNDVLVARLDEVAEARIRIEKRESKVKAQEEGLRLAESQMKARTDSFNEVLATTLATFDVERTKLAIAKTQIDGKLVISQEKEKQLNLKEQDMVRRETLLADRYATLARAIEEHKRKNLLPKNYKS